jgi:hypothetical protein
MSWPPYLLKLRINNESHKFGLWLPLFIIWPIVFACLLAVFLILLPFALLAMIFTWQLGWWRPALLVVPATSRVLCSLHGTTVDVDGQDGHVEVEFY